MRLQATSERRAEKCGAISRRGDGARRPLRLKRGVRHLYL